MSSLRGDGIEKLKDTIEAIIWSGQTASGISEFYANDRQADAASRALKYLTAAEHDMKRSIDQPIISQQLRAGLDAIGEIVGKTATEDILSKIFSTFCIGK